MNPPDFFRPDLLSEMAYPVPDARGMVKLDAMENPYDWPAAIIDGWLDHLRSAHPNRYPDPQAPTLKQTLRHHAHVPQEAELLLGNGSDEIIQILLMALAGQPGATVLAPEPTFVMYRQIAKWMGIEFKGVPLNEDFSLDQESMLTALEQHQPKILFLAYPNNPTGNLFDSSLIETILHQAPGLVVIDEAYAPFAEASFMPQIGQFDNLLVMRTLSKLGLAGLRLGFLAGPKPWLKEFDKLRLPYNINVLTQLSAEFALAHSEVFDEQTSRIRADRNLLSEELSRLDHGIEVFPSAANFILLRIDHATRIFEGLKECGILIKNLDPAGGLLKNCLRVTVGTAEENQRFLAALSHVLTTLF